MKAGPLLAAGAIESPPLRPPRVTPVRRYAPSCDGARRYPPPGAPDKQCPVWGAGPHPRDPTGRKTNTAPWGPHDVAHLLCSSHSYGFGAFGTPHSSVGIMYFTQGSGRLYLSWGLGSRRMVGR
jgi:hypothetical protein